MLWFLEHLWFLVLMGLGEYSLCRNRGGYEELVMCVGMRIQQQTMLQYRRHCKLRRDGIVIRLRESVPSNIAFEIVSTEGWLGRGVKTMQKKIGSLVCC